jgi:hypothetical protein
MILVKQAIIGRTLVVKPEEYGKSTTLGVGFDSATVAGGFDEAGKDYAYDGVGDLDGDGEVDIVQRYKIFDSMNVVSTHIIKFQVHAQNSLGFDPTAAAMTDMHQDVYDRQDFFSLSAWQPVSLRDKMAIDELEGVSQNNTEALVTVEDAYKSTLAVADETDEKVEVTKHAIKNSLASIDDKMRRVNLSYATCEETIFQIAKDAMRQLVRERERKLNTLRSTEHELRRKLTLVNFTENHLQRQAKVASMVDFLRIYKSHTEHRKTLHGIAGSIHDSLNAELKAIAKVSLDITVEGSLEIVSVAANAGGMSGGDGGDDDEVNVYDGDEILAKHKQGLSKVLGSSSSSNMFGHNNDVSSPTKGQNTTKASKAPHSVLYPTPPPAFGKTNSNFSNVDDLITLATKYPQYSLSALSERKVRQLTAANKEQGSKKEGTGVMLQQMFAESRILESTEEASSLFYSLPFVTKRFSTHVIFQGGEAASLSEFETVDISMIQRALKDVESPTLFLLKSGDYVFGAYASSAWRMDEKPHGTPSSFLFSLTLDLKIPYVGRTRDLEREKQDHEEGRETPHESMLAGQDYIMFGAGADLVLHGDLTECESTIEGSYGFGMEKGGKDAKCLLAGTPVFPIDSIEIFEIIGGR